MSEGLSFEEGSPDPDEREAQRFFELLQSSGDEGTTFVGDVNNPIVRELFETARLAGYIIKIPEDN